MFGSSLLLMARQQKKHVTAHPPQCKDRASGEKRVLLANQQIPPRKLCAAAAARARIAQATPAQRRARRGPGVLGAGFPAAID
jgi:hypothetical protein